MKKQLYDCVNELEHREQSQRGLNLQLSDAIFWLSNRNNEMERLQAELTNKNELLEITRSKFEEASENSTQSFFS